MTKLKSRPTYANVMATVAVFLALGGVATAITIPKKSVGAKQLKKDAVTNPKVADKAIGTAELGDGAVTAGKLASGAAVKNVIVRETVVGGVANNNFQVEQIDCQAGEKAIAGGGVFTPTGSRNLSVTEIGTSTRLITPVDSNGDAVAGGSVATGYLVSLQNVSGATRDYHGYVVCAQL